MIIFTGSNALSPFRQRKLLSVLQTVVPEITSVSAHFEHFVHSHTVLDEQQQQRLQQLFDYGESPAEEAEGRLVLITPRPGTISPWSSKATDIIHNAGLTDVLRAERGTAVWLQSSRDLTDIDIDQIAPLLHDRMMEVLWTELQQAEALFTEVAPAPFRTVDISKDAQSALNKANKEWGLALSEDEIEYLADRYSGLGRDPSDVELMMFAQANSEHCRHKIFNADWLVDGEEQEKSLFAMIRNTHKHAPEGVLSAYKDNSSVVSGSDGTRFFPNNASGEYGYSEEPVHIIMKVETHNHPTAISPFPGAATGAGGEIRDEGATGNGSKPKAGLSGFSVSNLRIPGYEMP